MFFVHYFTLPVDIRHNRQAMFVSDSKESNVSSVSTRFCLLMIHDEIRYWG